ncbi:MAG TPA: hypothetical protein VL688_06735 [Verrucomicrobiae bacterium]|jgi:hypothetical protein|nr:hypothetical protein [Verrucomicrobiae bacterium]
MHEPEFSAPREVGSEEGPEDAEAAQVDKRQKALLLIHEGELYFRLKDVLAAKGIAAEDFIFRRHECSFILMDQSYFDLNTGNYLRDQKYEGKIFLVLWEQQLLEALPGLKGFGDIFDDVLILWETENAAPWLDALSLIYGKMTLEQILVKHIEAPRAGSPKIPLPGLGRVA